MRRDAKRGFRGAWVIQAVLAAEGQKQWNGKALRTSVVIVISQKMKVR
jgi:hypothetical protein